MAYPGPFEKPSDYRVSFHTEDDGKISCQMTWRLGYGLLSRKKGSTREEALLKCCIDQQSHTDASRIEKAEREKKKAENAERTRNAVKHLRHLCASGDICHETVEHLKWAVDELDGKHKPRPASYSWNNPEDMAYLKRRDELKQQRVDTAFALLVKKYLVLPQNIKDAYDHA